MRDKVLLTGQEWVFFLSYKYPMQILSWAGADYISAILDLKTFSDTLFQSTIKCSKEIELFYELAKLVEVQQKYISY